MSLISTIRDAESLRDGLDKIDLSAAGSGDLVKISNEICFLMYRYENPTLTDAMNGINVKNPDYQSAKLFLEKFLNNIYEELNKRDIFH